MIHETRGKNKLDRLPVTFNIVAYAYVLFLALICFIPFWLMVSGSFTADSAIWAYGYRFWPPEFSIEAYRLVFQVPEVMFRSYGVTIFITIVGTMVSLFITTMTAFVLHRRDFKARNFFAFFFYFTTLFSGGLIPWYLLMLNLGMRDSYLALIVPPLLSVFNIIVMRTFFSSLPSEIGESGKVDGANDFTIYWKLYLPMAIPGIATIGLFTALVYWNDWFNAMLYINEPTMYPLQYQMFRVLSRIDYARLVAQRTGMRLANVPSEGLKLAMACVTIGPVILFFPFIQRYFIRGLTIGAVKG